MLALVVFVACTADDADHTETPTSPEAVTTENVAEFEVTVTPVEGDAAIGPSFEVVWRLEFGCPDGRCDGTVTLPPDLGRRALNYALDSETYSFGFTVTDGPPTHCLEEWVGKLTPTSRDEQGPVTFNLRYEFEAACPVGMTADHVDYMSFGVLVFQGSGARE